MTIKALAHAAQQHIQATTASPFKRTHVHELLAAAFGFKSYAAFSTDSLLMESDADHVTPGVTAELIGRIVQLDYSAAIAPAIAQSFADHLRDNQVAAIRLSELLTFLEPPSSTGKSKRDESGNDEDLDDREDDPDLEEPSVVPGYANRDQQLAQYRTSRLLMDSLTQAGDRGNAKAHWALAMICRCKRPDGYLHEESLKGRILNPQEQIWAEAYVRDRPRFNLYQQHLRQAAIGGIRQAAIEYAEVFDDPDFYNLAETGAGPIDPQQMSRVASSLSDPQARDKWLRVAAEEGAVDAIRTLAAAGDSWALAKLAELGDLDAMRELAKTALARDDLEEAWKWQHLAQQFGGDLTKSTMRAYHDGGSQDGQEYDDDFGGPLYVGGHEGLDLKPRTRDDSVPRLVEVKVRRRLPKK